MKLIVDRIEDEIVVCEDYDTKRVVEVRKEDLSFSVSDGDVLTCLEGVYVKDEKEKEERLRSLKEKFARVKRKKDIE